MPFRTTLAGTVLVSLSAVAVLGERLSILSRGSVLVVNDQEPLRLAVLQALRARGFDARGADSGQAALALARSDRPDVIVIDLDPPAVDG